MWWSNHLAALGRISRLGFALMTAGLVAACFQPLYGDKTLTGGPGLNSKLGLVDVAPINAANGTAEARLGIEIRNALLFDINNSDVAPSPAYRLNIKLTTTRQQVIVDIYTTRPDVENYGIDAVYTLTEIATGKVVVNGQTFARVSYDIPGQQQRFARARGLRDAENRASKVIADQIRSRLASYFVAGA